MRYPMAVQDLLFLILATETVLHGAVIENKELFPDVTYEEIESLDAACTEVDNCRGDRHSDNLDFHTCICNEFCDQYDTCCLDSKYRAKERKVRKPFSCAKIYRSDRFVYMVDSCHRSWKSDNSTEALCKGSAEEMDDLFLAIPVTSHKTGVTYRNYYCAVCNMEDDREQLKFWDLSMTSLAKGIMESPLPDIHFISSVGEWIVGEEVHELRDVKIILELVVPEEIKDKVLNCVPGLISDCPKDWTDVPIKDKCSAYMAILAIPISSNVVRKYRNVHCAICNDIDPDWFEDKICPRRINIKQTLVPSNTFFVRLFSIYDKESKCADNEVYDTLAKKCRKAYKG